MKTMRDSNWKLFASALAMLVVASACRMFQEEETALYGKVMKLKGSARYSGGDNKWQPLKVGATLKAGALIQTAKDSFVDMRWPRDSMALRMSSIPDYGNLRRVPYRAVQHDVVRLWQDSVLELTS